jgi:inner membrane protein
MLFRTHILLGIVMFLFVKDYFSGGYQVIFFLLILLGSIFPDIDNGKSKMKKASGVIGGIISFLFKHRGIFHSLFFAGLISFLLAFFWKSYYGWGFFLGYFSHLIGDSLTPMGVHLLYPITKWKIRGPIRTGGIGEWAVLIGLIILIIKEIIF